MVLESTTVSVVASGSPTAPPAAATARRGDSATPQAATCHHEAGNSSGTQGFPDASVFEEAGNGTQAAQARRRSATLMASSLECRRCAGSGLLARPDIATGTITLIGRWRLIQRLTNPSKLRHRDDFTRIIAQTSVECR